MPADLKGTFSGLIIDMDGVLYRGNQPLPGARELFPALREAGLSYLLLTNNATMTPQDFTNKLGRMGIVVAPEFIMTSAVATARYLQREYPEGGGIMVVGEEGLLSIVTAAPGFHSDGWQPRFVVMGLDYHFTYDKLQRACSAIRAGAHFIATNADATLPVEGGEQWPGAGSLVAALRTCSGVEPAIIGKPSRYSADIALAALGLPANRTLCVGDRLETDILMGARAGIPSALVLTGVSTLEDVPSAEAAPDYIFRDLHELREALGA